MKNVENGNERAEGLMKYPNENSIESRGD